MTYSSFGALRPPRPARTRNAITTVLVAALLITATACASKDSSTAPAPTDVAGNYTLATVQAKTLPVKVYDGPVGDENAGYRSYIVTVRGGEIRMDDQGYYVRIMNYHIVADGEPSDGRIVDAGTYEINKGRIVFTKVDGTPGGSGPVRAGEITMSIGIVQGGPTYPYVFRN